MRRSIATDLVYYSIPHLTNHLWGEQPSPIDTSVTLAINQPSFSLYTKALSRLGKRVLLYSRFATAVCLLISWKTR